MRTSRFSNDQIVEALRQAETGTPVVDICRTLGVTETTFPRWKQRFTGPEVSERRELKQLRDENGKLKGLVAGRAWRCASRPDSRVATSRRSSRRSVATARLPPSSRTTMERNSRPPRWTTGPTGTRCSSTSVVHASRSTIRSARPSTAHCDVSAYRTMGLPRS